MLRTQRLLESHRQDAGGDFKEASTRTAQQVVEILRTGKAKPTEFSIKEMFKTFVSSNHPMGEELFSAQPEKIAEAMAASDFPWATGELIHSTVIPAYDYTVAPAMELVTEVPATNEIEDIVGFGSVDRLEVLQESQPYPLTRIDEKRLRIRNFKLGHRLQLTREAIVFDKTGQLLTRARRVGEKSGQQMHEYIVTRCLDGASTMTKQVVNSSLNYDGTNRDMYSADHSAWDVVTNSNTGTDSLDTDGLAAGSAALMIMQDRKGDYISVMPKKVICGPLNRVIGTTLLKDTQQPDTANNASNIFRGDYDLFVTPFVTGDYHWAMGDFAAQMWLMRVWGPETTALGENSAEAFSRDIVAQFKFSDFVGVGAIDYRFAWKSTASS